jgi:hypothetical protein
MSQDDIKTGSDGQIYYDLNDSSRLFIGPNQDGRYHLYFGRPASGGHCNDGFGLTVGRDALKIIMLAIAKRLRE